VPLPPEAAFDVAPSKVAGVATIAGVDGEISNFCVVVADGVVLSVGAALGFFAEVATARGLLSLADDRPSPLGLLFIKNSSSDESSKKIEYSAAAILNDPLDLLCAPLFISLGFLDEESNGTDDLFMPEGLKATGAGFRDDGGSTINTSSSESSSLSSGGCCDVDARPFGFSSSSSLLSKRQIASSARLPEAVAEGLRLAEEISSVLSCETNLNAALFFTGGSVVSSLVPSVEGKFSILSALDV
jgi:hypothetical protein